MKLATTAKILATGLALLMLVFEVAANDPIFVKWLVIDDPGDETIRVYWQRAEAGELDAEELVDLGTMLFYRGWPNDAVTYFRQALDLDPELSDAWFRIGLVEHHSGDLGGARSAYKKCLKKQSGHAWANFYLGLLEEQTGEGKSAMKHYEMAFKHAPELANPKVNPEILSSKLQLGAQVRHFDSVRFKNTMPMPFMDPAAVRQAKKQLGETPPPTSTPEPELASRTAPIPVPAGTTSSGSRTTTVRRPQGSTADPVAGGAANGTVRGGGEPATELPDRDSTPYGVPEGVGGTGGQRSSPTIGETSPEASLLPVWPGLYEIAKALV
jgi:hypothetical protein